MSQRPTPRRSTRTAAVAALVALPVVVAACGKTGGSSSDPRFTVPVNPSVSVIGTDNLFDAKTYTAKAGAVTFAYTNKGNVSHTLLLKTSDGTRIGDRLFLAPGNAGGLSVTLTPGTYEMYCDVPGHKESGMDASLTVS